MNNSSSRSSGNNSSSQNHMLMMKNVSSGPMGNNQYNQYYHTQINPRNNTNSASARLHLPLNNNSTYQSQTSMSSKTVLMRGVKCKF